MKIILKTGEGTVIWWRELWTMCYDIQVLVLALPLKCDVLSGKSVDFSEPSFLQTARAKLRILKPEKTVKYFIPLTALKKKNSTNP